MRACSMTAGGMFCAGSRWCCCRQRSQERATEESAAGPASWPRPWATVSTCWAWRLAGLCIVIVLRVGGARDGRASTSFPAIARHADRRVTTLYRLWYRVSLGPVQGRQHPPPPNTHPPPPHPPRAPQPSTATHATALDWESRAPGPALALSLHKRHRAPLAASPEQA